MIETKMCNLTTYSGLLFASRQLCHRSLQAGLRSCLGGGKTQMLSSPEEYLVEDKGLPALDCVRQKSDKELGESGSISGQDKLPLAGKMLSSSRTKTQIRQCLQANMSLASGVQRSSDCQNVSAQFHFCQNMTHPSRNLLSTRNCGHSSVRNYQMLHVSTSSLLSLSSHRYFIRCGSQMLTSYFSLSSQALSSTLSNSSLGITNVTLDKTSERSVSNGELRDKVYGKHIAKGDNCGSNEPYSLDSSCINQDNNVDVRNGASYEDSKETTQFNPVFNENNDDTHNIYAKLYFNLMNGKLQNGSHSKQDEETAQFDSYAKMYSKLTKSDEKDREESEIRLTHIDTDGKAVMVDVGDKTTTLREARAEGKIYLGPEAARLVKDNKMKKGDVLTVAQIAGITAAKQTAQLIPLCHNINLTKVDVACVLNEKCHSVDITSLVRTIGVTGVEMEALTAVSIAALTIYDMCKAVTHDMVVSDVRLVSKSGGKRHFQR